MSSPANRAPGPAGESRNAHFGDSVRKHVRTRPYGPQEQEYQRQVSDRLMDTMHRASVISDTTVHPPVFTTFRDDPYTNKNPFDAPPPAHGS